VIAGDDCRSDLLVAARRGRLSDGGRLALDAHLAGCPSCRMSHEVSADFDGAEAVDLRDGARIRALADRARSSVGSGASLGRVGSARSRDKRSGTPVRLRALGAAAALIVFCGSASAAVWWWRRSAPERATVAPRAAVSTPPASAPARRREEALVPQPPPLVAPIRLRPRPALHAALETRAGLAASATSILQQATEARQRGDRARAAELYRRLQHEFPASAEAVLSAIPLGGLLLGDGLPRAALVQFDDYLGRSQGGALIPEALYGRARALGRLGDRVEERRTWTRLCADFPDSAYAPLGRHRLAEIE
jgi:TolA-binding protein